METLISVFLFVFLYQIIELQKNLLNGQFLFE